MSFDELDTIGGRIKLMRAAKFKTASEAARAFGWNVSTYLGYENGDREPSKKMAGRIADAFGVELGFLLLGHGLIRNGSKEELEVLPVVGRVMNNGEIEPDLDQLPVDGFYQAETALPVINNAAAVIVVENTMWPRYEADDLLIFSRIGQVLSEIVDGTEAAVQTEDGRRFVKRIRKAGNLFDLESYNYPPIQKARLIWAAEILSVIRRGRWVRASESEGIAEARRARMAKAAAEGFFQRPLTSAERIK